MIYKRLSNGSPNSVYHVSRLVKHCVTSGKMLCCILTKMEQKKIFKQKHFYSTGDDIDTEEMPEKEELRVK